MVAVQAEWVETQELLTMEQTVSFLYRVLPCSLEQPAFAG